MHLLLNFSGQALEESTRSSVIGGNKNLNTQNIWNIITSAKANVWLDRYSSDSPHQFSKRVSNNLK